MNLIFLLAKTLRPDSREEGYRLLEEKFFSRAWVDELRAELDRPDYADRCAGEGMVSAKAQIDDFINRHEYNQINPDGVLDLVRTYRRIENFEIRGKSFLDFGSGRFNPFAISILLYANGAERCVSYEPGDMKPNIAELGRKEIMFAILTNPGAYRISDISEKEMRERVANLNVEFAASRDTIEGPFDYVMSRSVLEHVEDIEAEARFLGEVCPGRQIHRVDFADHRFAATPYDPFAYMKDGVLQGINGLLPSEMKHRLERGGLKVLSFKPAARTDPPENVLPRYRGISETDAGVLLGDFVLASRR